MQSIELVGESNSKAQNFILVFLPAPERTSVTLNYRTKKCQISTLLTFQPNGDFLTRSLQFVFLKDPGTPRWQLQCCLVGQAILAEHLSATPSFCYFLYLGLGGKQNRLQNRFVYNVPPTQQLVENNWIQCSKPKLWLSKIWFMAR